MLYEHTTRKSTYGLVVKHIFVELTRRAMRHLMGYQRVVVYMLMLVGYHTTITLALSSLA
jgi:hypothetical protein